MMPPVERQVGAPGQGTAPSGHNLQGGRVGETDSHDPVLAEETDPQPRGEGGAEPAGHGESGKVVHEAGTSWDIRMPRDGHMQEIRIITFAPDEVQQLKQSYPKPVVELGCQIEKVRNEVTDEAVNFDEECKKVWAY
jgi:hypothetical protein